MSKADDALVTRATKERAKRAAETPEQREARLAKRRARYADADWVEKHREDCRAYYSNNKEKFKEYETRRRAKPESKDWDLRRTRRRNGIIDATAERRSGMCCIQGCDYVGPLVMDHWHHGPKKGQVRGWLCSNCNAGLGFFADAPARMRGAAEYIELADGVGWPLDTDQPAG